MSGAPQPNTAGQAFFLRCWLELSLASSARRVVWGEDTVDFAQTLIEAEAVCHAAKAGFQISFQDLSCLSRQYLDEAIGTVERAYQPALDAMTTAAAERIQDGPASAARAAADKASRFKPAPPPYYIKLAVDGAFANRATPKRQTPRREPTRWTR